MNNLGEIIEIGTLRKGDFFEKYDRLYKYAGISASPGYSVATCFTKGSYLADVNFFKNNDTAIYKGFQIID
jgi:hypothetical protein